MKNPTRTAKSLDALTPDFILKRSVEMSNGCIEWQGPRDKDGYGRVYFDYKTYPTSRLMARLVYGEPEPGMFALHSCDNPPCVNPQHLRWGTPKENTQDSVRKGRHNPPKLQGFQAGTAKLDFEKIAIIFEMRKNGYTYRAIGKIIGLDHKGVLNAYKGNTYKKETEQYRLEGNN